MVFRYQKYYFRVFIGMLLVVGLFVTEYCIWTRIEIKVDDYIFILITVAIMYLVVNVIFKYMERFVVRSGKILKRNDFLEVILCKKIYRIRKVYKASFYTFSIYRVLIGKIYIEYEDEKSNKKKLELFSEDLQNIKFIDTSLFTAIHENVTELKEE